MTDSQQLDYVSQVCSVLQVAVSVLILQQNSDEVHCYCDKFSTIDQSQKSVCQSYLQKSIYAQILQYFAAFVVIVVNLLLEVISSLAEWMVWSLFS